MLYHLSYTHHNFFPSDMVRGHRIPYPRDKRKQDLLAESRWHFKAKIVAARGMERVLI